MIRSLLLLYIISLSGHNIQAQSTPQALDKKELTGTWKVVSCVYTDPLPDNKFYGSGEENDKLDKEIEALWINELLVFKENKISSSSSKINKYTSLNNIRWKYDKLKKDYIFSYSEEYKNSQIYNLKIYRLNKKVYLEHLPLTLELENQE